MATSGDFLMATDSNAYPASAKFPRAIRSAGEALSRARSDGDNQLSSEHPVQW